MSLLNAAPKYLPSERAMIYTTPTISVTGCASTLRSSSAPESTKNSTFSGIVQFSTRSMSSSDVGQMLQKMVPVIMHTSSREKPQCTGPTLKVIIDRPTVSITNAMEIVIRLLREWKKRSTQLSSQPIAAPSTRDSTISTIGSTTTAMMLTAPLASALAMPKDTENSKRPTASSMATTSISRRVIGPSALYWRTTIIVAAGAVAEAIAPSVIAQGMEIISGKSMCSAIRAISTTMVAMTAWTMPMTMAFLPISLSCFKRNSLPMENAMKPSAVWLMIFIVSTWPRELKPSPCTCSAPMQNGPSSRPATRYAVTAGR